MAANSKQPLGIGITKEPRGNGHDFKARIHCCNKLVFIGRFTTPHEARLAYDLAVSILRPLLRQPRTNYEDGEHEYSNARIESRMTAYLTEASANRGALAPAGAAAGGGGVRSAAAGRRARAPRVRRRAAVAAAAAAAAAAADEASNTGDDADDTEDAPADSDSEAEPARKARRAWQRSRPSPRSMLKAQPQPQQAQPQPQAELELQQHPQPHQVLQALQDADTDFTRLLQLVPSLPSSERRLAAQLRHLAAPPQFAAEAPAPASPAATHDAGAGTGAAMQAEDDGELHTTDSSAFAAMQLDADSGAASDTGAASPRAGTLPAGSAAGAPPVRFAAPPQLVPQPVPGPQPHALAGAHAPPVWRLLGLELSGPDAAAFADASAAALLDLTSLISQLLSTQPTAGDSMPSVQAWLAGRQLRPDLAPSPAAAAGVRRLLERLAPRLAKPPIQQQGAARGGVSAAHEQLAFAQQVCQRLHPALLGLRHGLASYQQGGRTPDQALVQWLVGVEESARSAADAVVLQLAADVCCPPA